MNKKGFTLVELLAVIAILAVIALISVPTIANVIRESREDSYVEQERSIVNAAKTYMANNSLELPKQVNNAFVCKSVEELQKAGLLSSKNASAETSTGIKNSMYNRAPIEITPIEKGPYFDGAVKVTWDGKKYQYNYVDTYISKDSCS